MQSIEEQLLRQFYEWELRGRGWQVWPGPVDPEPPFRPFLDHYLPPAVTVDDGQIETPLSRLVGRLIKSISGKPSTPPRLTARTEEENTLPPPEGDARIIELQTLLPATFETKPGLFEQFLRSLSHCREVISFEIAGREGEVIAQLAVHEKELGSVRKQLRSFFPLATFLQTEQSLSAWWNDLGNAPTVVVDCGLNHEFMRPLALPEFDPFIALIAALTELEEGDMGCLQVLFKPTGFPWSESILKSVSDCSGGPLFEGDPDLLQQARWKVGSPLYAVVLRLAARSWESTRAWEIARDIAGALGVYANPRGNELIPLHNDEYPPMAHEEDVLKRQTHRSGMLLNLQELAGFVHLPQKEVALPHFHRQRIKTRPVPARFSKGPGLCLGFNTHDGVTSPVYVTPEDRVRHMHVIGASGTGKSTLLFNLIAQAIESGEGVSVLDPHGDLIERLLGVIPENRVRDVVLFDPSDQEYAVGFNVLAAHSDLERNILASDVVSIFRRLSSSWGDQMESVLDSAIHAILLCPNGGTLLDLRRFLLEPPFRDQILKTVEDPEVRYYWTKVYPHLGANKSLGPILIRLAKFLSHRTVRHIVGQKDKSLDFPAILNSGKIFLGKLAQGAIGVQDSYLLGSLLVAKFQQAALTRQNQEERGRTYHSLFIDEFHNFICPSMAEILTGARKYRLGLVLAHHGFTQLQSDRGVASTVLECHTRVCFRVRDQDLPVLENGFASFDRSDIQKLETGNALCRIERSDHDFNLAIPFSSREAEATTKNRKQSIRESSRETYATAISELQERQERLFDAESEVPAEAPAASPSAKAPQTAPASPPGEVDHPQKDPAKNETKKEPSSTGTSHQQLKQRIAQEAENLDYHTELERHIPEHELRVDVALRRGNRQYAIQVATTTTAGFETQSTIKCLNAGFYRVAIVVLTERRLENIRGVMEETLAREQFDRVGLYLPDALLHQLREWAREDPEGGEKERSKPRKRKISLVQELTPEERRKQEQEHLKSLAEAMKKNPQQKNPKR